MHAQKAKARGFTLLEIVVALAVMALCVTAVLQTFVGATRSTRVAGDYYEALQVAETRMALLLAQDRPERTEAGDTDDTYRWETRVEEYQEDWEASLAPGAGFVPENTRYTPYHYQVRVSWGDRKERTIELSTIRMGAGL